MYQENNKKSVCSSTQQISLGVTPRDPKQDDANLTQMKNNAYYCACVGIIPKLTAIISIMVALYRESMLEEMKQAEELEQFNHNLLYYYAEIYSVLSQCPTEKEREQKEDVSYYYLSRAAWFFALAKRKVEVSSILNRMYVSNSKLMLKEADNVDFLMKNPLYGMQLYETLVRHSVKLMLDQSKFSAIFERLNIDVNSNVVLSDILSSGLIVSDAGVSKFKSGQYSFKNSTFDIKFDSSRSSRELEVLTLNGDENPPNCRIDDIYYQGDIGYWLYNACKLALKSQNARAASVYICQYVSLKTEHAISVVSSRFEMDSSTPSLIKFHVQNDPDYIQKNDELLRILIKSHLFQSYKNLVEGRIPALDVEELDSIARYNINIVDQCYNTDDFYINIARNIIECMIDLNPSYVIRSVQKEIEMNNVYLYRAMLYKAMAERRSGEWRQSENYRWAGYYYSLTSRRTDCIYSISQFVKVTTNAEDAGQPREDALNDQLQQLSPFYCAEILNQLVKKNRYQGQEERIDFLQQAYRLYSAAGASDSASYVNQSLINIRNSSHVNGYCRLFKQGESQAASTSVSYLGAPPPY